MRLLPTILCLGTLFLWQPLLGRDACTDAGENLKFIRKQTLIALQMEELNMLRYHAYKALNTLESTRPKLSDCGCERAEDYLSQGAVALKKASREASLRGSKILLYQAAEQLDESMASLEEYRKDHRRAPDPDLGAPTPPLQASMDPQARQQKWERTKQRIDDSLQAYEASLELVLKNVECKEAHAFLKKIYDHSNNQLDRSDLTEAQRYYQERTRALTADSMARLGMCP